MCYTDDKEVQSMSNREKCIAIIDSFSEMQLANIAAMLQAARNAVDDAADDAFCLSMFEEYQNDPERGEAISIEDAAALLGVTL